MDEMYELLEQMLDQCPDLHSLTAITFLQVRGSTGHGGGFGALAGRGQGRRMDWQCDYVAAAGNCCAPQGSTARHMACSGCLGLF